MIEIGDQINFLNFRLRLFSRLYSDIYEQECKVFQM